MPPIRQPMNKPPNTVAEWADWFWSRVGITACYPRDLEQVAQRGLPVYSVKLPGLSLYQVEQWAERSQFPLPPFAQQDRRLLACLLAFRGHAIIFQEANSLVEEQRFSFGHELAHFLRDHLGPRLRTLALLGESIRPVLDGHRSPTPEEQMEGVLKGVPLRLTLDLMERGHDGQVAQKAILEAEDQADLLALELLAPEVDVLARIEPSAIGWNLVRITSQIQKHFGLPSGVSAQYAAWLRSRNQPHRSFRDWLEH